MAVVELDPDGNGYITKTKLHPNLANIQDGTTDLTKLHTQNADTKLDEGGSNEVSAAELAALRDTTVPGKADKDTDAVAGNILQAVAGGGYEDSGFSINSIGSAYLDIGIAGDQGFGVGLCPSGSLPPGMAYLPGTETRGHDNYGNYQFQDGSIVCCVPIHWMKIGTGSNGLDVNDISVVPYSEYASESEANAAGYFLPRCFIDGGQVKACYFVDKYHCSKNAWGTGYIASSIKDGLPISTDSAHNPIADLTACASNYYSEAINAAKARDGENGNAAADPQWFCCSRFIIVNLAMLSMAHGQAATATTYCAWYDAEGATNYPKGCNNDALGDIDDGTISYISDGYDNCGKTGSGAPFAKTTHNGQNCGVADLNGNMYRINIGITSDGTSYYVADEATAMKDFTAGNSGATDHWGATGIAAMMTEILIPYMEDGAWTYMGSGTNQVLSEVVAGNGSLLRSVGMPKDSGGYDGVGTNQFGKDGVYQYLLRNELCVRSGGYWGRPRMWGCRSPVTLSEGAIAPDKGVNDVRTCA